MAGKLGNAPRFLVLRTDKIGDVLTATPIFRSLKERFPSCHITAWVGRGTSDIVALNPHLDAFEEHPRGIGAKDIPAYASRMRDGRFDAVIFMKEACGSYVVASAVAGIPRRVGCISKWYWRLLTENRPHSRFEPLHIVERSYDLTEAAIGERLPRHPYTLIVPTAAVEQARRLVPDGDYAVIHPYTGGSSRPWIPERYAVVGRRLRDRFGCPILVTGTEGEASVVRQVVQGIGDGAIDLAGKTDLLCLAEVLRGALVLVAGSTGALHIAASQKTPAVMIEPSAPAEIRSIQWRPWMSPNDLCWAKKECPNCWDGCDRKGSLCSESIPAEEVAAKAIALAEGCRS